MFGIVVLAAYALLMIGVTLIFTRRATSAESFHVADRRIGATVAAMSIAATWIWAPSLFTSSEMAYTRGVPGMFWFLVPNVLCLIIFIPFAKKIRRQYPEGITLTGYMAERYRSPKVKGVTPSSWARWLSSRRPCSCSPAGRRWPSSQVFPSGA